MRNARLLIYMYFYCVVGSEVTNKSMSEPQILPLMRKEVPDRTVDRVVLAGVFLLPFMQGFSLFLIRVFILNTTLNALPLCDCG